MDATVPVKIVANAASSTLTPTFWSVIGLIIVQLAIVATVYLKGIPSRTKAQSDKDSQERKDSLEAERLFIENMMETIERLQNRVGTLERDAATERADCARRMLEMETNHRDQMQGMEERHARRVSELEGEIKGLRNTYITKAQSAGHLMEVGRLRPVEEGEI